jgi:transposase
VSGLGLPVELTLTPGQAADVDQAEALLADHPVKVVIGDKAFDSDPLVGSIEGRGAEAVIPPRANRVEPRAYDQERYRDRNLAERFWSKVKQFRRVATRYDKTGRNFLAFVQVAAMMVLLQ